MKASKEHLDAKPSLRLDKWLWYARFFKTRSIAQKVITSGKVRVDQTKVSKASTAIRAGQVLTFPQADIIKVIRILELGERRGPAPQAQCLYEDMTPENHYRDPNISVPVYEKKGRPTKKDRRKMQASSRDMLERP